MTYKKFRLDDTYKKSVIQHLKYNVLNDITANTEAQAREFYRMRLKNFYQDLRFFDIQEVKE